MISILSVGAAVCRSTAYGTERGIMNGKSVKFAALGFPWGKLGGALRKNGALQNTHDTPSVSPFGLPAPPEVEPRALCAVHIR